MKRVLTAVILIPLVILALFKAPLWLFTLLVLGVALLAAREYFDIAEKTGFRPMRRLGYALLVVLFVTVCLRAEATRPDRWSQGLHWSIIAGCGASLLLLSPFLLLAFSVRREPLSQSLGAAAATLLALLYVGITLVLLLPLRAYTNGPLFLLYLMLLVWCGDIAAYYVGRAIGRHKLAPRISPGKTWEGAIASVLGAVIIGLLLFHYLDAIAAAFRSAHLLPSARDFDEFFPIPRVTAPLLLVALFAVCVNVAAQIGDLVESALKRGAGVKDSGTLLPGHGGVLDRIDALLFALPVGLLFYASDLSGYFTSAR